MVLTVLERDCLCIFSKFGRRNLFRYIRRSGSSSKTRAHVYIVMSHGTFNGRDKTTDLADCLEHSDGMFEITDMKYRNNKFNVCIMANTIDRRLSTSFTESTLFCSSLERKVRWGGVFQFISKIAYQTTIEHSIFDRQAIRGGIEITMCHFKFRYFDGVLCIQKTELQFFTVWGWDQFIKDKSFRLRTWLSKLGAKQFPSLWEQITAGYGRLQ